MSSSESILVVQPLEISTDVNDKDETSNPLVLKDKSMNEDSTLDDCYDNDMKNSNGLEKEEGESVDDCDQSSSSILDNLVPPSKLQIYSGYSTKNRDEDLDRLMGFDIETVNKYENKKVMEIVEKKRNVEMKTRGLKCLSLVTPSRIGKTIVLSDYIYTKTKFCIIGPQWPGPLCTCGLIYLPSYFFIKKAYESIGIISTTICIAFTVSATMSMFLVSCRDPGIVRKRSERLNPYNSSKCPPASSDNEYEGLMGEEYDRATAEEEGWRYCAVCDTFQPPQAAHCPDCQVCVDGYDHHCPWMGTCIGKKNYTAFMMFNLSWLLYLLYAIFWVALVGPRFIEIQWKFKNM